MNFPLYRLTGYSVVPSGKSLVIKIRMELLMIHHFMEFFMVNSDSVYHRVLGRLALKELRTITSIQHLCIKFSTKKMISPQLGMTKEVPWITTLTFSKKLYPGILISF